MHYKIMGTIVKSEYSAKTEREAAQWLVDWIKKLPKHYSVLDFGCGKLRYSVHLAKRVNNVVAVDSKEQIERLPAKYKQSTQNSKFRNIKICDVKSSTWKKQSYHLAICTNVLSAIPSKSERVKVLRKIRSVLHKEGCLLIVTQFRNSYFNSFNRNPNAKKYLDGWLVEMKSRSSFYGIVDIENIENLCAEANLKVNHKEAKGENAVVVAVKSAIGTKTAKQGHKNRTPLAGIPIQNPRSRVASK